MLQQGCYRAGVGVGGGTLEGVAREDLSQRTFEQSPSTQGANWEGNLKRDFWKKQHEGA